MLCSKTMTLWQTHKKSKASLVCPTATTSSDSEVTVRSRWDRSDAESGADAESLTVAVLYRWAGEVLSFRAQGSADTVEAVKPGSRGDHRDVTVQMLKAED
jgi:hypothetical protein